MNVFEIALALFVSLMWGLQHILYKHLTQKKNIITLMFLYAFLNFLFVSVLVFINFQETYNDIITLDFFEVSVILFIVIFTIVISNYIFQNILKNNDTYIITALVYSSPIFTLLISYFFLSENIDFLGILGVILITSGIISIAIK